MPEWEEISQNEDIIHEQVKTSKYNNPKSLETFRRVAGNVNKLESPGFMKALAMKMGLMSNDTMRVSNADIYKMNSLVYGGADTDSSTVEAYWRNGMNSPDMERGGYFTHDDQRLSAKSESDQSTAHILLHELVHKEDYNNPEGQDPGDSFENEYHERPTELRARAISLAGEYASTTGKIPKWSEVEEEILAPNPFDKDFYITKYDKGSAIGNMAKGLRHIDKRYKSPNFEEMTTAKRDSLVGVARSAYEEVAKQSGY